MELLDGGTLGDLVSKAYKTHQKIDQEVAGR
jgi:hypothetical protein